VKIIRDLSSGY